MKPIKTEGNFISYGEDGERVAAFACEADRRLFETVISKKPTKTVKVRFEDPRTDRISEPIGPFEWVQLTYDMLRDDKDNILAFYRESSVTGENWIYDGYWWSDIITFIKIN